MRVLLLTPTYVDESGSGTLAEMRAHAAMIDFRRHGHRCLVVVRSLDAGAVPFDDDEVEKVALSEFAKSWCPEVVLGQGKWREIARRAASEIGAHFVDVDAFGG